MKVLFVGDVVGRPGRRALADHLQEVIKENKVDFTIVNGENSAHGKGITEKIFNEIISYGADVITMGNHTYAKADIYEIINDPRLLVPLNMEKPKDAKGFNTYEVLGKKVLVANVCTEAFMNNVLQKPIDASHILKEADADIKIIDLHGEATAEKLAYMYYYKNDFNAVLGTHTHVQTADEDVFDGCAYISDVGMCGAYHSIIGRDIDEVLSQIVDSKRTHYTVAKGESVFSAVLLEICENTNRTLNIKRIQIRP